MEYGELYASRAQVLLSTLGLFSLLLCAPPITLGAPAAGFPLQSSQASPLTGAVTISAPDVTVEPGLIGVQFKVDGYNLDSLDTTSPFEVVWNAASVTDGDHTLTADALYSSGAIIQSAPLVLTVANPPGPVQSPFLGSPFPVPGVIQAEDFDNGGEGVAYHDNVSGNAGGLYRTGEAVDIVSDGGSGFKVNNFETGEWLEYTINVTTTGTYRIEANVASTFTTASFSFKIDGVDVTGPLAAPHTGGWTTYQFAGKAGIALSQGTHILQIFSNNQYADIDAIRITEGAAPPPPPAGTPQLPMVFLDTTYAAPVGGAKWRPLTSTEFQNALNSAALGDVIELQAETIYTGPFTLPNKTTGTGWIYVRSSAYASLPAPGTRVGPSHASLMPKLVIAANQSGAIRTATQAHHYRFVGIEFQPTGSPAFDLLALGSGSETSEASLPHNIVIDRCYVHGLAGQPAKRGIALNGKFLAVIDSYLADFKDQTQDTQAILGWNGPGPFKIVNNYLEATGENMMFGGGDPSISNLVPSDIEIRNNHFFKPTSWRGVWAAVKNNFELKNARRLLVEGNIFENNWLAAQNGWAVQLTVRNQDGACTWCTIEDVTFRKNIVRHASGGLNILSTDDPNVSQNMKRVLIQDNLFDDINGTNWGSTGRLFQILGFVANKGSVDLNFDHNTGFQQENLSFADGVSHTNFVFTNNLAPRGANGSGFTGSGTSQGISTLNTYFPGYVFLKNAIIGANASVYPADNFFPVSISDVGFVNDTGGDYHLSASSPYKNAGTDGRDVGADIDALNVATACAVGGACGAPSPPPPSDTTPPPTPGVTTITLSSTNSTGATFSITWPQSIDQPSNTAVPAYLWNAAYNDGQSPKSGTVSANSLMLSMPYHTSGTTRSGFFCVKSVDAAGNQSLDQSCNAFTVPALSTISAPPPPPSSATWPNEPAGFTPLTDWPFNTVTGSGWNQNTGNATIVPDGTAPLSPANVMQMPYPAGFVAGSAPDTVWRSLGVDEMYFGFWWKPSNPWQDQTAGNKIVFPDVGTNHTFLIMMPGNHEIWAQLDFGADNSHLLNAGPSAPGPINVWGNRVTVSLGQWHRIEGHMKKSTNSTSRDGILRWWVDGVNAGNYTNVNYLGTFQEFQFSPTWGGVGGTKTENDYYWYDHVRISIPGTGTTPPPPPPPPASTLIQEGFEDTAFSGRGWYDNTTPIVTTAQHHSGVGAAEFHFLPGATTAVNGGSMRHLFTPSNSVYISYWVKYSTNWVGSGQLFHPHEFLILSNQDGDFDGPSHNWLTAYVEHNYQNGGIPRLALQDNKMINTTFGTPPVNLVGITENRSTDGCNGVVETGVVTSCFNMPPWYNGKEISAPQVWFQPNPGTDYKGDWNHVEAYFKLNSIAGGIGQADGTAQYWFNGMPVIDRHDIVFRTGMNPNIQFHQFMIAPYIGSGSPADQYMWVDDLSLGTQSPYAPSPPPPPSSVPGTVSNLSVSNTGSNSVTLSFTEVNDGTGSPAKYDVRFDSPVISWGSASSVASGTCATPLAGTQIGAAKTCTVLGLAAGTQYQFQLIAYRGTLNVDAVFGGLSNVATGTTSSSSDTTAPTVSITAPANNAMVSGGVTVSANASDNVGVVGVQFKLDGANLGSEATASPYSTSFNTTLTTNGNHILTALARDAAGNTNTSAAVTVTVNNPSATAWPNEPAGSTLITDYAFSDPLPLGNSMPVGNGTGWAINNGGLASMVSDPTAPYSPLNVGQWSYPTGFAGGSAPATMGYASSNLANARDLYFGIWWKPSNPWQGHASGVNKILFIEQYGGACGNNLQNQVLTMYGQSEPYLLRMTNEFMIAPTYNLNPNVNNPAVTLGVWHRLEIHRKLSNTSSSQDGILQWWMDGTLVGNYSNINDPQCPFDSLSFSPTWGGVGDTKAENDYYRYDHVHISQFTGTQSSDTIPPTVTMTAPANGATVSGAVTVSANASDNVGVAGVQFKLDGSNTGAEINAAPYNYSLDSTLYPNGSHTLTATARDTAGNMNTSAGITVTLSNAAPRPPPGAVSNLSVSNTGSNSVTLSFTEVNDGTGSPAKYDVRFDSPVISWGSASSVASGTCATPLAGTQIGAAKTCTVLGLAAGTQYQFQLIAYRGTLNVDAVFGGLSNVATGTTSSSSDTTAPTVSITAPANNAMVSGGVTVSANASDNVGVAGVQFQLDGVDLGAELTAVPYSISWNTTTASNGGHILTAVARDAAGNTATSAAVNVTTMNTAPTPPVISDVGVSNVTSSSATLTWTTNAVSSSQVDYGPTSAYGRVTSLDSRLVTAHSQTLAGLQKNTWYHFRMLSRDAAGNLAVSRDFTFKTRHK